jgi:F0F1-type ATP synthase assembly protein I
MKYWRSMLIPIPISMLIFFILFFIKSSTVAYSFLSGGAVCWLGEYSFAFLLVNKIKRKRPQGFLWVFYIAEIFKLALFALLFVVAVARLHLLLLPTLIGFIVNLFLFWILAFKALGE